WMLHSFFVPYFQSIPSHNQFRIWLRNRFCSGGLSKSKWSPDSDPHLQVADSYSTRTSEVVTFRREWSALDTGQEGESVVAKPLILRPRPRAVRKGHIYTWGSSRCPRALFRGLYLESAIRAQLFSPRDLKKC